MAQGGRVYIPKDEKKWPKEWQTVVYKTYPRCEKIALARGEVGMPLAEALQKRRSVRHLSGTVSEEQLGALLYHSAAVREGTHRPYPSGGGRYPVETYVVVFRGEDINAGVYHYAPKEHALEVMWRKDFMKDERAALTTYPWAQDASLLIVMTGVFHRSTMKYDNRGYRYALLEAGHIGQNIQLVGTARGINTCPVAGTFDEKIEKLLDIDGVGESVVYTVAAG